MKTNVNTPIFDEHGNAIPPLVGFIMDFVRPVLEAENKKNPRKIEDEINLL